MLCVAREKKPRGNPEKAFEWGGPRTRSLNNKMMRDRGKKRGRVIPEDRRKRMGGKNLKGKETCLIKRRTALCSS